MKKARAGLLAIASFFSVMGCVSSPARTDAASCSFEYTPQVQKDFIIPELEKIVGNDYIYFDYDEPVIDSESGHVVVQLSATRKVGGKRILFEDLFFVEIDPCLHKVVKSYTSTQYHRE